MLYLEYKKSIKEIMNLDNHPRSLPTDQLQPNPFQPRGKIFAEDVSDLVKSVKIYGILEPLVVAHTPAGYQIIAGERRWRAAREAGLEEVPVIIKETSPRGMLEMAIIENVQRVDLSPIERAQAFQQLIRDFNFTHTQVAEKVSKSIPYVSNSLKLLKLPDAIADGLSGGMITEGHARALGGIENETDMIACYKIILKENASVRRAEELSRKFKKKAGQTESRGRSQRLHNDIFAKWSDEIKDIFQEDTQVRLSRSNRQTKVTIVLKGTPEQTDRDLKKILKLRSFNK